MCILTNPLPSLCTVFQFNLIQEPHITYLFIIPIYPSCPNQPFIILQKSKEKIEIKKTTQKAQSILGSWNTATGGFTAPPAPPPIPGIPNFILTAGGGSSTTVIELLLLK